MITAKELKSELLKDPEFKAEYEALTPETELAIKLIKARQKSKLSQAELAARMGKKQPHVARLESGKANPSIKAIQEYVRATGQKVTLKFS